MTEFDPLAREYVAVDFAADDRDADFDLRIDRCRVGNDQRAAFRVHLTANVTVDAQQIFERKLAIEFRIRIGSDALFDGQPAATGRQLTRDDTINRHVAAIGCFAGNYRHTCLKIVRLLRCARRPDSGRIMIDTGNDVGTTIGDSFTAAASQRSFGL